MTDQPKNPFEFWSTVMLEKALARLEKFIEDDLLAGDDARLSATEAIAKIKQALEGRPPRG